jgi:hypothetical protein
MEEPVGHPRLQAASHRKALTVGMTAALLAVPMAGVGAAATVPGTELLDEEPLEASIGGAVEGTLEGVEEPGSQVLEPVTQPVEETVETVTETTAPVTEPVEEVVDKVVESVTGTTPAPPATNGPKPNAPAPKEKDTTTAGGTPYQPVDEPTTRTRTTSSPERPGATVRSAGSGDGAAPVTAETAPAALQHEFTHSGLRSANGGLTLQPFQAPVVSSPFAFQAPQVADDVLTTTPSPSVAEAFEASATDLPRQLADEGLPGGVTATAAGLLLLVGAGHLLHRSGRLRVAATGVAS